jgi:hypothetical protein
MITLNVAIKMHYLPKRMDSSIGSPSSGNADGIGAQWGIANKGINGLLYFILYGVLTGLRLPPNKSGAVVLQAQRNAHHLLNPANTVFASQLATTPMDVR